MVSREARIEAIKVLISEGWNPPPPDAYVMEKLARSIRRLDHKTIPPANPRGNGCTEAEVRVLQAAAKGWSAPKTATSYGVSLETVKSQRASALKRLGARNITQAVAIAWREGIIKA